ncbi:TRAP transporter permease [Arenibaculum sp.]|jgi:TRAP transporter 4TM/12TM fusion protein|uniref:TRAP transporter permease n=1 Tax=Arenibaculum sp. TaxID=2865862 RepID=UPI002E126172|nr:TRAP transporter permease [Arenibaculum sp.]
MSQPSDSPAQQPVLRAADEPEAGNQRRLDGWQGLALYWAAIAYTTFHLLVLNVFPLETWTFRILHVAGGLMIGFALVAGKTLDMRGTIPGPGPARLAQPLLGGALGILGAAVAGLMLYALALRYTWGTPQPPAWVFGWIGPPLVLATLSGILAGWVLRESGTGGRVSWPDWVLIACSAVVGAYLVFNLGALQFRAGVMPTPPDLWVSLSGIALILELTRRVAGLALVVIALVFVAYGFVGPMLPGFLNHDGYQMDRLVTYLYTDNGILGPTTAVSSTYIILFIAFAAFLQASRVGDYFVNFAFAIAGQARGGPAKVAVFASGLMGMINGTSAGNVVATGSLTIPLMRKVGYRPQSAGAIEAAASTGGQIMPPIMGAGAFIMAEVTGIPYTDLIVAATIPALLYFVSIFFMVDLEAARLGMSGLPRRELPEIRGLLRQVYLFLPIVILVGALFLGYSVIRAGTVALVSAIVVSWLTSHRMGPRSVLGALDLSARMSIQLIAVCACAGIIVGVIGLTGVGLRFSSLLLQVAETNQLLALVFAMGIAVLLGMGMPTTAAYAVAASVVAPGLVQLGIPVLVAHFFVFYFAVISAITPPVALAAYAGAAIAGSDPMRTSITAFKLGLAAFIVPFMFFYSPALLMEGSWTQILRVSVTGTIGVWLLAASVQGWLLGRIGMPARILLLVAALCMIEGGWKTDLAGIGLGAAVLLWSRYGARHRGAGGMTRAG